MSNLHEQSVMYALVVIGKCVHTRGFCRILELEVKNCFQYVTLTLLHIYVISIN